MYVNYQHVGSLVYNEAGCKDGTYRHASKTNLPPAPPLALPPPSSPPAPAYSGFTCFQASESPTAIRPVMAGGITTLTDTTDNVKYYWCFQAMFTVHKCRTSSCGSNTYSKTFVTSSYWAGQRDYQWYDADFATCLPNTGSGAYTSTEKTCANNRCQALCNAEYGSNCASSTAEIAWTRSYMSYCYIFKGECQSSENSLSYGQEGFSERNAAIQSYGSVYRENIATTFFCHTYARRRALHEESPSSYNHQRALALEDDSGTGDDGFEDVRTFMNSVLDTEFGNATKVARMQKKTENLEDKGYYYG
jgi:hypothetical protein